MKSDTLIHSFQNSFKLVYQRSDAAPVLALDLWVRAGSADETVNQAGIAHVIEHMMFKGTKRRAPGQIASEVENLGGEINAYTSFDQTVYTLALSSRFAAEGVDILHDATTNSLFDPDELAREKLVILEEIKRSRDMPNQYLSRMLFSSAYRSHPYGKPVIGSEESVAGFTRADCRKFLDRWYVAPNMTLVAVGDLPPEKMVALVEEKFGTLPAKAEPKRAKRAVEQPKTRFSASMEGRSVTEVYFNLAFAAPGADHEDGPVLDLVSTVLGDGEASRLNARVKLATNLVRSLAAGVYMPADPGLFYVSGVAEPGKIKEAFTAACREIFELCKNPVGEAELNRARETVEADFVFQRETAQSRAQKIGWSHVALRDPDFEQRYLQRLSTATPADLLEAAKKYLNPDGAVLTYIYPLGEKPPLTEREAGEIARKAAKVGASAKTGVRKASEERLTLSNGVRVLVDKNAAAPIVALRAALPGGSLHTLPGREGWFHLVGECLPKGTKKRTVLDAAREIDRLGGHVEGFAGRNSFGLRAEFLAKRLDAALDLLSDMLLNPAFTAPEVAFAKEDAQGAILRRDDNPAGKAFRAFEKLLYGAHPYGADILGDVESVRKATPRGLKSLYAEHADAKRLVIALSGDVDAAEVAEILEEKLAALKSSTAPDLAPNPPEEVRESKILRLDSPHEQTHIVCGFLGATLYSEERLALKIANSILSGQGGRLFAKLRDEMALAYSVTSTNVEGIERGYIAGYIATSKARAEEARVALLAELKKLGTGPIADDEVKKAKQRLAGGYDLALQENSFRASQMALDELYGLDWLDCKKHAALILATPKKAVERAAEKYLSAENWVAVVVGG